MVFVIRDDVRVFGTWIEGPQQLAAVDVKTTNHA